MGTKERIMILRLLEKMKENPSIAKRLGLSANEETLHSNTPKN